MASKEYNRPMESSILKILKPFFWIVFLMCIPSITFSQERLPDSLIVKCFRLEEEYTGNIVRYIQNKEIDLVDSLHNSFPTPCIRYEWHTLINTFLICTKYPEQIDSLSEVDVEFLLNYVTLARAGAILYENKKEHHYMFYEMPSFGRLHVAVQNYLNEIYPSLDKDSQRGRFVGTLIGVNNHFFDEFTDVKSDYVYTSNISFQSFMAQKEAIRNEPLRYFSLRTSFANNRQTGNSMQFDYFSMVIIEKQFMLGATLFGFGLNTTDANYELTYKDKTIKPNTTGNIGLYNWYSHIFLKDAYVKPFAGMGWGILTRQDGITVNGEEALINIMTYQLYPEVGLLLGKWPNYFLKIHASYHFNGYGASFDEEPIEGEDSIINDNLNQNEWRVGISLLLGLNYYTKQKAKLMKLY